MGMTRAFHAGSTGSNPVRGITRYEADSDDLGGVGFGSSAHSSPTSATKRLHAVEHSHAPRWLMILSLAIALGLTLDATIDKAHAAPTTTRTTATWYGPGFYGNTFACGGRYSESTSRGVAHMTLPCGTKLVVCSGASGTRRCVWVQVIDTGAFNPRHLDLTARTARDLIGCRNCRPFTMPISWRVR